MEKNMPKQGEFCWNELMTSDDNKAKEFYQSLFGWQFQGRDINGVTYHMIKTGDKEAGGLMQIPADQAGKMPSHWTTYIYVDNIDDSVTKAQQLGAKVIVPVTPVEDFGRFAILQDPTGASLGLWQCTKPCH